MPVLKSDILLLDTERRTLRIITPVESDNANEISIAPLTLSVLAELLINSPHAISIDYLNQQCWPNTVVSDETVVQRIALLRKTLEKYAIDASSIENLRGQGYRWVPKVYSEESQTSQQSITKPINKLKFLRAGPTLVVMSLIVLVSGLWLSVTDVKKSNSMPSQTQELLRQAHSYRQKFDAESMSYAVSLYEQTLRQAPENVSALAGLTMAKSHQFSKFNLQRGNVQEINGIAQRALELAPRDPFVLQANGLVRDVQGDIAGAVDFYEKALQFNPDETSLYGDLAYLHTITGAFTKAFGFHIKGLPGQQQFRQSQLALWFHLLGETASSQYWHQQAILLNPHNLTDKLSYLDWLTKTGQLIEAVEFANDLKKQGIDDHRIQLSKAKAHALLGNEKRAKDAVLVGLTLQPHHAESMVWLQVLDKGGIAVHMQDNPWSFYTDLQFPWPQHYVQMALFIYNKQYSDGENRDTMSSHYLKLAVENGYREGRWLKALVDNGWLPDTPEVRQLLNSIAEAVDAERQRLNQNDEFQNLLNQTARAIVSS